MPEQLAFDQIAWQCGHVDGDEWPMPTAAIVVQGAADQLLAGAAFAMDHHRQVGAHQARQDAIDLLHRRRAPDQRQVFVWTFAGSRGFCGFDQRALHGAHQFAQVERLRQIVERAPLRRLHRRQQRRVGAHDDDPQVGPALLDARHQIQAIFVRHDNVGDHQIAVAVIDPAPQCSGMGRGFHVIAGTPQRLAEDGADGTVIIGNQDRGRLHRQFLLNQAPMRRLQRAT